jgi:hypothetical protein
MSGLKRRWMSASRRTSVRHELTVSVANMMAICCFSSANIQLLRSLRAERLSMGKSGKDT